MKRSDVEAYGLGLFMGFAIVLMCYALVSVFGR
jgi:hypothetical protein